MITPATERGACRALRALPLVLVLLGAPLQSACGDGARQEGVSIGLLPAATVIIDEPSPLTGCFPADTMTVRTIRLYNTGSADFVVDAASFSCAVPGGGCALVTVDPPALTVRAGDPLGEQVTLSIVCSGSSAAVYGELTFSDTAARVAASLSIRGSCTSDVTLCCLTSGWCCPSSADPICSEFTDPLYRRTCLEICCPPPCGCSSLYDFPC